MRIRFNCRFIAIVLGAFLSLLINGCVSEYSRIEKAVLSSNITPNVYCEAGIHEMPAFVAEQVLVVRPLQVVKEIGGGKYTFEMPETELVFPDGVTTRHIEGTCTKLRRLWKKGEYRIIVFDRSGESLDNPLKDYPWTRTLRAYAMTNSIPISILHGTDTDAPVLPGIPIGLRQYWQCPECARLYSELNQKTSTIEWNTANMLLFPLNVLPDMLVGVCYYTGAFVYSIFTSDEFGWFVIGLPIAPFWGAIDGGINAWNGRPFWNMELMDGGKTPVLKE